MVKKKVGAFIAVLLIILLGIFLFKPTSKKSKKIVPSEEKAATFHKEGGLVILRNETDTITEIEIEIADDKYQRDRGMMYRKKMRPDRGMIFLMDRDEMQSFWMKNTHISLDIIYISSDSTLVSAQKYTTPYSTAPLPSEGKALFVLETNAGFWDKHNLQKGDKVHFWRD